MGFVVAPALLKGKTEQFIHMIHKHVFQDCSSNNVPIILQVFYQASETSCICFIGTC